MADADFSLLTNSNRHAFTQLLDSCIGKKAIVWDGSLMKPFGRVCGFKQLQADDVLHMFELSGSALPPCQVQHIVYLVKPALPAMQMVAESVRASKPTTGVDAAAKLHLVFVPRQSVICEQFLRDNEVLGRFSSISNLSVDFFPLDSDLISLETSDFVRELLVYDNWSPLYDCACALDNLHKLYGPFTSVQAKGDWACRIVELWRKKREQDKMNDAEDSTAASEGGGGGGGSGSVISQLIVLDRWLDLVTPLLTQLTYAGLIDEMLGITGSKTRLPVESSGAEDTDEESGNPFEATKELELTCASELYAELRDLNFNAVGPVLHKRILQLNEQLEARHNPELSVREYKEFVRRLPLLMAAQSSAAEHTALAEFIKTHISHVRFIEHWQCEQGILSAVDNERCIGHVEAAIAQGAPLNTVLRLICLQSVVSDGLKAKVLDAYKIKLMQTYGFDVAEIVLGLESAGLLKERGAPANHRKPVKYASLGRPAADQTPFAGIKSTFRLLQDEVDETSPNDVSYVFSGYAPLTARLCQYAATKGWAQIEDALKRLPQPHIIDKEWMANQSQQQQPAVCLVLIVGGCTYAELAAIRFLNKRQNNVQFLVATTHMTTGDGLIASLSSLL